MSETALFLRLTLLLFYLFSVKSLHTVLKFNMENGMVFLNFRTWAYLLDFLTSSFLDVNTIQQTWHCLLSTLRSFDPADVWCICLKAIIWALSQHYALIILHWLSLYYVTVLLCIVSVMIDIFSKLRPQSISFFHSATI